MSHNRDIEVSKLRKNFVTNSYHKILGMEAAIDGHCPRGAILQVLTGSRTTPKNLRGA